MARDTSSNRTHKQHGLSEDKLRELYGSGLSDEKIGELYGLTGNGVSALFRGTGGVTVNYSNVVIYSTDIAQSSWGSGPFSVSPWTLWKNWSTEFCRYNPTPTAAFWAGAPPTDLLTAFNRVVAVVAGAHGPIP